MVVLEYYHGKRTALKSPTESGENGLRPRVSRLDIPVTPERIRYLPVCLSNLEDKRH
jgi:hypothetical protein